LRLARQGCYTLAQDEASCVVFGMPKEAIKLNAVSEVLGLDQLGDAVIQRLNALCAATGL